MAEAHNEASMNSVMFLLARMRSAATDAIDDRLVDPEDVSLEALTKETAPKVTMRQEELAHQALHPGPAPVFELDLVVQEGGLSLPTDFSSRSRSSSGETVGGGMISASGLLR